MKKIKFIAMLFIATLVFVSCQNEDALDTEAISTEKYPEIASKLQKMYFNTDDLKLVNHTLPDGTTEEVFEVEGNILFTREHIMNMQMGGDITTKQYRTNNLVSTPWWGGTRTIKIIGYYGSGTGTYGLNYKARVGLSRAVSNYNALALRIKFVLSWGKDYRNQDIIVYNNPNRSGAGGRSFSPYGGNPAKWITIWNLGGYSYGVNEAIMTRSMGYAIGLRHTDWFNLCGTGRSEGVTSIGAVHIPGTPVGIDWSSVMLSCFPSSSTTGNFSNYDKVALRYIY